MVKTTSTKTTKAKTKKEVIETKAKIENPVVKMEEIGEKKESVKMNKTLKKILLYFSILWATTIAVLWIGNIWWNIGIEVIWKTIATYLVLFVSVSLIPSVPKLYRSVKYYPELVSIGVWLLSITIAIIGLVICGAIWKEHSNADVVWQVISTMWMINFAMIVIIFAMDKWWSRSST